jgi:hypothetical protein
MGGAGPTGVEGNVVGKFSAAAPLVPGALVTKICVQIDQFLALS